MILPNKIISLEESCLPKAAKLLQFLSEKNSVQNIYCDYKDDFFDVSDFIDALDLLFVLKKIQVDLTTGDIQLA
ncbi:ABC-three component system middle component 7 [Pseudomonas fluorescens]|uniref:ABC-three component system middle component 7 n=1 Tax=Pseudomonas fluorescens TaxID=294 RepID=UPI0032EA53D9